MYQLTVLVKDKVSEADRNGIFDGIKKTFSSLIKEDLWGVRSLAYSIKHNERAFYGYFEFEAEPTAIISLDKNIRLNEDIIRYLIVKKKVKRQKSKSPKKQDVKEEKAEEIQTEKVEAAVEMKAKGKEKKVKV